MVKQRKWLVLVATVVGLVGMVAGVLYAAQAQQGTPMYVAEVRVGELQNPFRGFRTVTVASVKIVEADGVTGVPDCVVTGTFTGCGNALVRSGTTDSDGWALIKGRRATDCCVLMFTVNSVTKDGWEWLETDPLPSGSKDLCGGN
jgi:hypothetical protein